ncbi:hypothetical protein CCYA_CCYA07G2042 [Cyanidiococcus yangmingshanensis]|nr:hypothetical protein CCYA_CCYA07G2042 [Cyanidiococcus yangmingshanensis]
MIPLRTSSSETVAKIGSPWFLARTPRHNLTDRSPFDMSLFPQDEQIIFPGEMIGHSDEGEFLIREGCYKRGSELRAFRAGLLTFKKTSSTSLREDLEVSAIRPELGSLTGKPNLLAIIPRPGARVCARVLKVNRRQAVTVIQSVETVPVKSEFQGIIRQQDVRDDNWDSVCVYDFLQPGDLIEARVLSELEQRYFYLSIASSNFLLRR